MNNKVIISIFIFASFSYLQGCIVSKWSLTRGFYSDHQRMTQEQLDKCLCGAVRGNRVEEVGFLLRRGAKANTSDDWYEAMPILTVAVDWGYVDVARALLEAGATPDVRTMKDSRTPLMRACESVTEYGVPTDHYSPEMVDLLVRHKARMYCIDSYGRRPLHHAAMNGRVEAVETFLNAGADIEARDFDGQTALNYGAKAGSAEMVRFFLHRGADLSWRDFNNQTPYVQMQQDLFKGSKVMRRLAARERALGRGNSARGASDNEESEETVRKKVEIKERFEKASRVICTFRETLKTAIVAHTRLSLAIGDQLVDYIQLDPHATELASDIANAAVQADVPRIKNYLDAGGNIDARTKGLKGRTMIELARAKQGTAVVEYLSTEYHRRNVDFKTPKQSPQLPMTATAVHYQK